MDEAGIVIRWGVAGPGGIAAQFADAIGLVDDGEIVSVASRSQARADEFAERFDVPRAYDDYDALGADEDVDVVYVATPHSRHAADTIAYLEAGKHVLCEKPFALNADQARRMVDAARTHDRFLMEAMWSRFLPAYRVLDDLLADGRIGEPVLVEADFGVRFPFDPASRLFDREQGGGALLDLGIYPVQLCTLVLGLPDRVVADGHVGSTGVDELVAAVLHHPGGRLGVVKAAITATTACSARISGTDGWIELPPFMHAPQWIEIGGGGGDGVERIDAAYEGEGLRFEILEVHRCLEAGTRESEVMPLSETVAIAALLDDIREQIGLVYDADRREHEDEGAEVGRTTGAVG